MNNTALIEVEVKTNPLGKREATNYKWIGKSPYVYISWELLGEIVGIGGDTINIQVGPYKLLKIEHGYLGNVVLYVRADKLGALRVALYRSTRLLDLMYRRLIITLAVWKLADFSPARVPSWKDIKIVKRLADWRKHESKNA
jgi:hypothetical protein